MITRKHHDSTKIELYCSIKRNYESRANDNSIEWTDGTKVTIGVPSGNGTNHRESSSYI